MNISLLDDDDLVSRLGQSSSSGVRTTGVLHLSDIYKSLMVRLQPKRFGKPIDAQARKRMEVGIAFENVLEKGLADKYATIRPGEIVSPEGVYMSPDGINPVLDAGEEYKCTWMSCRPVKGGKTPYTDEYGMPTPKYIHWFFQMKGYGKWLGANRWLLRVLHVNGDYSYINGAPCGPLFLSHLIEFTDEELDENWDMHIRHAKEEGML